MSEKYWFIKRMEWLRHTSILPILFIFHLSLFSFLLSSCQSNSFQIRGYTKQLPEGDTICLVADSQPEKVLATAMVNNGQFHLTGETDSVFLCRIYARSQRDNGLTLFLEPGNITVELNISPNLRRVSGTRINNEWQHLTDSIQLLGTRLASLSEISALSSNGFQHDNYKTIDSLHHKMSDCILNTAHRNRDNPLGQYLMDKYKEPEFR